MNQRSMRPLVAAGTALGIGMGGFFDGILFHQILQAHNMLSAKYPPNTVVNLQINMFWDGLFHAFTWIVTAIGIAMLWNAAKSGLPPISNKALIGSMALGWGLFNLIEGIIDHHVLHIHHVREIDHHLVWDVEFLGSGAVLIVAGLLLIRSASPRTGSN